MDASATDNQSRLSHESELSQSPSYHTVDNNPLPREVANRGTSTQPGGFRDNSSSSFNDRGESSHMSTRHMLPENSRRAHDLENSENINSHHFSSSNRSKNHHRNRSPRHSHSDNQSHHQGRRESPAHDASEHYPLPTIGTQSDHSTQTENAHHARERDLEPTSHGRRTDRSPPPNITESHSPNSTESYNPILLQPSAHRERQVLNRVQSLPTTRNTRYSEDLGHVEYVDIFAAAPPREQQYRMLNTFYNIPRSDVHTASSRREERVNHNAAPRQLDDIFETSEEKRKRRRRRNRRHQARRAKQIFLSNIG